MRSKRVCARAAVTICAVTLFMSSAWAAHESVQRRFGSGTDGAYPDAGLIADGSGNLYGTTYGGGSRGAGTVFELSPAEGGGWTEKVLHNFGSGNDGAYPEAALIFDANGNLYGTTDSGGIHVYYGTVFELSPREGGGWTERVLHSFGSGLDGRYPSGVVLDANGNLYGTTALGGSHYDCTGGCGTVFEILPRGDGSWTEKLLHSFGTDSEGQYPDSALIFDAAGNLYGTTDGGGIHDDGTLFELSPREDGSWTNKVLHSFNNNGRDGWSPGGGLIFDAAGNLYGTTYYGGIHAASGGYGTVFELLLRQDGSWTEKILHSFNFNGVDGAYPDAALVFDAQGNLYGTTAGGGSHACPDTGNNCGTVFEMSPRGDGTFTERVLHNFNNDGHDGIVPQAGLTFDAAGNLYGTTYQGGTHGEGTVFEVMP
ncbi:MAG: choice-of-anchor tandem repeat GloVer-containing protein [Candidatus Korobacteraceae bacterium]